LKTINVKLSSRSYPIVVGARLSNLGSFLKKIIPLKASRVHIVTHPSLASLYAPSLTKGLEQAGFVVSVMTFPDGENQKNLLTVQKLYESCAYSKLRRNSTIIALGGGVAGDTAGFVAATYLRGIRFVNVPTTLLAMVDSAIGGKTGVDLPVGKNLVGSFWQPSLVWCDLTTLSSLPEREWKTGMAEIVKYGVIKDAKMFQSLEKMEGGGDKKIQYPLPTNVVERLVESCARIKADVVSRDEFETKGLRQILNFGHTVAHALEASTRYEKFTHGEAVAIGMCAASRIALKQRLLSTKELTRLQNLLTQTGLPISVKPSAYDELFWQAIMQDKKIEKDEDLQFVLPKKIGSVLVKSVPKKVVMAVILNEVTI